MNSPIANLRSPIVGATFMWNRIRRFFSQFFNRSRTINNEPLNRVSLVVIILIDIFILVNVFSGLDDISRWPLSPTQTYPCYASWNDYRAQTTPSKHYDVLRQSFPLEGVNPDGLQQSYIQSAKGHLGHLSDTCLTYANDVDQIATPNNRQIIKTIDQKQTQIATIEVANRTLRAQYDSTLLEKIAGQPRQQSINTVEAAKAKETLDQNTRTIVTLKADITQLKTDLIKKPESAAFLSFLADDAQFKSLQAGYDNALFWYPSIQLIFQALFLLPLIVLAGLIHKAAQRRGYGLIALISWHLLVIVCIPLIAKIFEFLQIGLIFDLIVRVVNTLLGGLLFLVSYLYIFLIPLVGFVIIKFFQRFAFNPKIQAANRVQKSRCIRCAKRIRPEDDHCPHCGYHQYTDCSACHELTYKYLPHCRHCGATQEIPNRP